MRIFLSRSSSRVSSFIKTCESFGGLQLLLNSGGSQRRIGTKVMSSISILHNDNFNDIIYYKTYHKNRIAQQYQIRKSHTLLTELTYENQPSKEVMDTFMVKLKKSGGGCIEMKRSDNDSRIIEVILRNEEKRNSLTGVMMVELHNIINDLAFNDEYKDVTAMILYGAGQTFCSGADLNVAKEVLHTSEDGSLMCHLMTNTLTLLRRLPVITVAAIEGSAIGGGAELTTACDFRIMNGGAKVHFIHAKMGVCPGWGGAFRLTQIVGRKKALELIAGSQAFFGVDGHDFGFVDRISDGSISGGAVKESYLFLQQFLQNPIESVRKTKLAIAAGDEFMLNTARVVEADCFQSLWGGEANRQAVSNALAPKK